MNEKVLTSSGVSELWEAIKNRSISVKAVASDEYDSLSEEEKQSETLYVITDDNQFGVKPSYDMLDSFIAPEMHRNIFRGKNLGTSVTAEQRVAIQDGSFKGLFVGDYWVINNVTWRIADMDYFLRCGDTEFTKHHLVIVPDTALYNAQMNESNVTTGGYIGSKMYTTNLAQAKTAISAAFAGLVLSHKDIFTNAVTNGYPSGYAWVESIVELMNEIMVYGTTVYTPANNGTTVPTLYTTGKQQLALFALDPKKVNIRVNYWLRDVVSEVRFSLVNHYGDANFSLALNSLGVRPYFCIG